MTDERKLTAAEHDARAMLLGRVYDWRDGTYCFLGEGKFPSPINTDMIDCITLELRLHDARGLPKSAWNDRNWLKFPCMPWESEPDT